MVSTLLSYDGLKRDWQKHAMTQDKMEKKLSETKSPAAKRKIAAFFVPNSKRVKVLEGGKTENPPEAGMTKPHKRVTKRKTTSSATLTIQEAELSGSGNAVPVVEHNLRLEAGLAAQDVRLIESRICRSHDDQDAFALFIRMASTLFQENARLSAGKATHPFFARQKVFNVKTSVPDENSAVQIEDFQPCPPMHVTQCAEDDRTEVAWQGWKLKPIVVHDCKENDMHKVGQKGFRLMLQSGPSSATEDEDRSYFQTCSNDSHCPELVAVNDILNTEGILSDGYQRTTHRKGLENLLEYMENLKSVAAMRKQSQPSEILQRVCNDLTLEKLEARLYWHKARHDTLKNCAEHMNRSQRSGLAEIGAPASTQNLLWTDVYEPKSSTEVCGNATAVDLLNTWLYNWNKKITGKLRYGDGFSGGEMDANGYSDEDWSEEDDSDIDSDEDDETGLPKTLLVTGPEGCGKSAAIYACAGEQGFTVIEVNASDYRNGALIKHKFGEAMESHGLKSSPQQVSKKAIENQDIGVGLLKLHADKQKTVMKERKLMNGSRLKGGQDKQIYTEKDESPVDGHNKRKTVILFEDVDKHFEEDKGFLPALVQLAKTTKRPIILTSNKREAGVPQVLEKFSVHFSHPTLAELVLHACLVCLAEGVSCSPWFVERLIECCQFDLRKIMMTLQFWGQGKEDKGLHIRRRNFKQWEFDARWLFELDVHHLMLPKVIKDGGACPLSLFVAEKISAAATKLEEHLARVAARKIGERFRTAELLRKEGRRNARRRSTSLQPRVVEDSGRVNRDSPPSKDRSVGGRSVDSPVKSLRKAKILARSLLRMKLPKPKCTVLLCSSEQVGPERSIESGNRDSYNTETNVSDGQALMGDSQDSSKLAAGCLTDLESPSGDETGQPVALPAHDNSEISQASDNQRTQHVETMIMPEGINGLLVDIGWEKVPAIELNASSLHDSKNMNRIEPKKELTQIRGSSRGSNQIGSMSLPGGWLLVDDPLVNTSILRSRDCRKPDHLVTNRMQVADVVSLSGDGQRAAVVDEFPRDAPNDLVKDAWKSLRESRETLKSLADQALAEESGTSSLSDLLDAISASDVIASVNTEAFQEALRSFGGTWNQTLGGNIGHCADWDICQEIASQLGYKSLQHSLTSLQDVQQLDKPLPNVSCILETGKDVPAVGKCMVSSTIQASSPLPSSQQYNRAYDTFLTMNPARQNVRQARLKELIQTGLLPKGRLANSALVEYAPYLVHMIQLEDVRRSSEVSKGRPRRFQHYLDSNGKSLSESDILELLISFKFRY